MGNRESELKGHWLGFALRLQGMARSQAGCAIISVKIIVDQDGNPLLWIEPEMKLIEPITARDWIVQLLTISK